MSEAVTLEHPNTGTPETGSTRRDWLRQGFLASVGVGAVAFGASGCKRMAQRMDGLASKTRNLGKPDAARWKSLPADAGKTERAVHLLNRAAFGPRPGDIQKVVEMGEAGWLEQQLEDGKPASGEKTNDRIPKFIPKELHPDPIVDTMGEDPAVTWRVNGLDIHEMEEMEPGELYDQDDHQLVRETEQAAILRATYSRHQLREIMADFWTNHFNIYALKAEGRSMVPHDTERVIRPHALGNFEDMLIASSHSPAMLVYLDNKANKKGVANENYARELLELHTLGVKSGYSIKDIQEVARCFTGWTVGENFKHAQFNYDKNLHDEGMKHIPFLNLTIMPNGKNDGQSDADTVIATLARHKVTARFLATKLCRRFLGTVPEKTVEAAANAYLKSESGSDIRALLRPILFDALLNPGVSVPIAKRPLDLTVSALRALAADTDGGEDLQRRLSDMGQPLYQWPMPDGFPEKASAWTSNLMPRWNFALALASNSIKGTTVDLNAPLKLASEKSDDAYLDTLSETILGRSCNSPNILPLKEHIRDHIRHGRNKQVPDEILLAETVALLISSPAFQWK